MWRHTTKVAVDHRTMLAERMQSSTIALLGRCSGLAHRTVVTTAGYRWSVSCRICGLGQTVYLTGCGGDANKLRRRLCGWRQEPLGSAERKLG